MSWTCALGWFRFTVPDANTRRRDETGRRRLDSRRERLSRLQPRMDLSGNAGGLGGSAREPNGRHAKCMWICLKN